MQAILVPTDFSAVAYNAARYAMAIAADLNVEKIMLYNAYQPYVSEDPNLGMPYQTDMGEFRNISENGLIKMKTELETEVSEGLTIEYKSDYNIISNGVIDACGEYRAGLIVMGISGTETKLEEAIIGSTAIDVAKRSEKPVIIVPAGAKYSGLKKILLAMDFKNVAQTTPVAEIKYILDATNARLDVLHVETSDRNTQPGFDNEKSVFDGLFKNYNPQYYFIKNESFIDGVNNFAVENNSDLIIVIPKKHGLFDNIFKRSHTKVLAFHSHIPIMSIHE